MKKKLLFSLFLVSIFISGCSLNKTYSFRDITEQEINHFIPYNYEVVNNIKLNIIKNNYNDKNIVLIVSSKDGDAYTTTEANMPKIITLGFDRKTDKWTSLTDPYTIKLSEIYKDYEITDLNSDNFQELSLFGIDYCGSTCYYKKYIFDFKDGIIKDLLNQEENTSLGKDGFYFNQGKKEYYVLNYIWNSKAGEILFDCHVFGVDKYKFNNNLNKFELIEKLKTNVRYNFNLYGDKNEKCNDYEKIQILRDVGLLETLEDSNIPLLDLDLSKYKKK